jgi:pimeloyl-ACP methyl ester carboxylesterase
MWNRVAGFLILLGVCSTTDIVHAGDPWQDYENYTVIDQDTTWSGHLGRAEMPKQTVVVNGAILTILPGTEVEVGMLSVYDGRIVAEGTAEQPIRFTKQAPDLSNVPADYAPYDRECYFFPEAGMIEFATYVEAETEASVFRHATFEGMGTSEWVGSDNCPWSMGMRHPLREWLVRTAHASERRLVEHPALRVDGGKLRLENVSFQNNVHADIETNFYFGTSWETYDSVQVIDSNFEGNAANRAVISYMFYDEGMVHNRSGALLLRNNWYGHASGPTTPENPGGIGEQLIGDFELDGFSPTKFVSTCIENCYSNVLFLPGLEASRLYRPDSGDDDPLWEPGSNSEVAELFLDSSGESLYDDLYTRDVIDSAYIISKGNVYKSFLKDLDDWKNADGLIADYGVAPYDWRLTLEEIVSRGTKTDDRISYLDDTDTPYILSELRRLAETSRTGKVTLIAHSNGGLVAKALTNKLGVEAATLVDKIVFVAVPQSGTPQAIGALLHGYDQGLPVDWFSFTMSPRTARMMAENMPSGYNLLPSEEYFIGEGSGVETPVVTFESGALTDGYIAEFGDKINSHSELHDFLVENGGKVAADSSDTASPSRVNEGLLLYSDNVKQVLDEWVPPTGVAVHQIAGFGEETLGTVRYWTGVKCKVPAGPFCLEYEPKLQYTPEVVVDGDGTVVATSALAMSESDAVSRWLVDLFRYNDDSFFQRKHAAIFEISQLRSLIKENILTQTTTTLPEYISEDEPILEDTPPRLEYYLHSPLALSAHDSEGRVISATDDAYPNATYRRFGEVQYLSVPASSHPTLVLDGLDSGSFTLEVMKTDDDEMIEQTTFAGIMTSPDTEVMMVFPDGTVTEAGPLIVDYDGNGTMDMTLEPQLGETVMPENPDTIAPVTTANLAGTPGTNNWYTSDVAISLAAIDDGSGVEKMEYSMDGTTWHDYTTPVLVTTEGVVTFQYFSTDKAGNKEEKKTESINIDKTAPEGKIMFNLVTQKLDITGTDNLGGHGHGCHYRAEEGFGIFQRQIEKRFGLGLIIGSSVTRKTYRICWPL